uniref:Uncharacterized protein n=1 Tax=Romanomermis culicivorax TaxID=13658 RepID=A0A915K510_ROMCU
TTSTEAADAAVALNVEVVSPDKAETENKTTAAPMTTKAPAPTVEIQLDHHNHHHNSPQEQ